MSSGSGAPSTQPSISAPLQTFVQQQMEKYNVAVTPATQKIYADMSSLKDTMVENIDRGLIQNVGVNERVGTSKGSTALMRNCCVRGIAVLERGERIDLLVSSSCECGTRICSADASF
jgi:hypothetical protein